MRQCCSTRPSRLPNGGGGNQLPVTMENIVSGALFTGALLYIIYGASPQRGKEPVLLEWKSPVGRAAEGA